MFVNEQKYYIYTLSDPSDNEVKYVGKTKDLKDRLRRHMGPSSLKESWTKKNKWLKYLKNNNLIPIMEILDEGNSDNIDALEIYWIEQLKTWGYKLKNDTKGGKGCEYWTGKKLSDKHKMKTKMNNPLRKEICQYEIGTDKLIGEFVSSGEVERITGIRKDHVRKCCKGTEETAGGYYWRFKDNYFPFVKKIIKQSEESKLKSKMNHPMRKVVCKYEIGTDKLLKEYLSSHDAENETGIKRGSIIKCCKGTKNFNTAGGFYWRFKDNYFQYESASNNPIKIEQYDNNWNLINIYKSTYELRTKLKINVKSIIKHNYNYMGYNWKIIK